MNVSRDILKLFTCFKLLIVVVVINGDKFDTADMDEGGCIYFTKVKRLNVKWISEQSKKGWYFPMLSRKNANAWTEILTGAPLSSEEDLTKMCLRIFVNGPVIKATGYGPNKAVWKCSKKSVGNNSAEVNDEKECKATEESSFPDSAAKAGDSQMAISWTDNSEYLLSVRCLRGKRIWALIASVPVVEERIKVVIFERIQKLGFDPKKALTLNYTNC